MNWPTDARANPTPLLRGIIDLLSDGGSRPGPCSMCACLLALFVLGCQSYGPVAPVVFPSKPGSVTIVEQLTEETFHNDPATIESTWVFGDVVTLVVRYNGGPAIHSFALVAEPGFFETNPVLKHISLSHDARGDRFPATRLIALQFSLVPVKEEYKLCYRTQRPGSMMLEVLGPNQRESRQPPVIYEFM